MNAPAPPAPASPLAKPDPRQRLLITPEGIAVPVTIASRGSRIGALILDLTIVTLAPIILVLVLIAAGIGFFDQLSTIGPDGASTAVEFVVVLITIFAFLARYGYFLAFELGPRGATPGKRAVGIRVAARPTGREGPGAGGGARLTPEAVVARNLLRDVELFVPLAFIMAAPEGQAGAFGIAGLILFGLIMALPLFNKDRLRAGDIIAGTWVVEAPRGKLVDTLSTKGAAREGTSTVTGTRYRFGDEELSVYGEHELQTLERVLREDRDEALSEVHAVICRKIGWDPGAGDERAFLEAFYAQLRRKLETDMRLGKRKADKHS